MPQSRVHSLQRTQRAADDGDLVVDMAFASSEPYERWWGIEILDVKGARLDRLNDGAPVLFNHDWSDLRGVHVKGSVKADDDGVLRGQARITSATQAGRDAIGLVSSEVLTKASTGYTIHAVIERSTGKDGRAIERCIDGATFERLLDEHAQARDGRAFRRNLDKAVGAFERSSDDSPTYIVIDWEPHENSLVTVPADNSVGVGRSASKVSQPAAVAASKRTTTMADEQDTALADNDHQRQHQSGPTDAQIAQRAREAAQAATQHARNQSAVEMEQDRCRAIKNLCKANNLGDNYASSWIGQGLTLAQVSDDLLKVLEQRGKDNPKSAAALGLTPTEAKQYSLMAAIRACSENNWSKASLELEASREIAKRLGVVQDPNKFFVPFEVQGRSMPMRGGSLSQGSRVAYGNELPRDMGGYARDMAVASGSGGGYLVSTDNVSFIDILRNRSIAHRMGARRLAGLVGNVTIPRQTGAATAVWLTNEAATITESGQTLGQLAMAPKTVGAYTEISRNLMLQSSPDAEAMVTADLGAVCALAVDVGAIRGSGSSGEPTGIVNTAGIGSVSGSSLAYAGVLEFQTDIAMANVMPAAGGYVTTPSVAALMMQRVKFSGTASPLWDGNLWDGSMAGFGAMSTNQMSSATMLFGDWSQLVIAEWGVLQIEVNPYANFQAGIIGVRAMVSVDVGLRYAAAFSLATSVS